MSPTFPTLVAMAAALVAPPLFAHVGIEARTSPVGADGDVSFMENPGLCPGGPPFVGSLPGMRVGVLPDALLLQLFERAGDASRGVLVELEFEGASSSVRVEGLHPRPGVHHFYHGDDLAKWRTGVRSYSQVQLVNLYEGIDLVVRGDGGLLEYDLVVEPGADLSQVVVRCRGAESIRVDPEGGG